MSFQLYYHIGLVKYILKGACLIIISDFFVAFGYNIVKFLHIVIRHDIYYFVTTDLSNSIFYSLLDRFLYFFKIYILL